MLTFGLTLPALKRRGFLDLRPALNLRVQMAISKLLSRRDQDSSQFTKDPAG